MKQLLTILLLSFALLASAADVVPSQLATNAAINTAVSNTIAQVTQEQIVHLLGAGKGRFKQYMESKPVTVDGWQYTWAVDEFLGPQGIGVIFRFYVRKDGRTFTLTDGHGPGYADGPEGGWVEVRRSREE